MIVDHGLRMWHLNRNMTSHITEKTQDRLQPPITHHTSAIIPKRCTSLCQITLRRRNAHKICDVCSMILNHGTMMSHPTSEYGESYGREDSTYCIYNITYHRSCMHFSVVRWSNIKMLIFCMMWDLWCMIVMSHPKSEYAKSYSR